MPPHCDTLDGPVVKAAKEALETGNVNFILPYAPEEAEPELRQAFNKTLRARALGSEAKEVADFWFFETAVRLHRQGEGAPYAGLKPAGLDEGPVVPRAEKALEQGDPKEVVDFLSSVVEDNLIERLHKALAEKDYDVNDVKAAREYIEACLGFILYSHHLYQFIESGDAHEKAVKHEHKAA